MSEWNVRAGRSEAAGAGISAVAERALEEFAIQPIEKSFSPSKSGENKGQASSSAGAKSVSVCEPNVSRDKAAEESGKPQAKGKSKLLQDSVRDLTHEFGRISHLSRGKSR